MSTPLRRALPTDNLPHGWQVGATMLLVGALFSLAWALSQAGLLDLAATGTAFFAVTLARQMGLGLTGRVPREFQGTARMIDQARSDFAAWIAARTLLSHALIAVAYTVAFLLLRAAMTATLTVIASPWLALAVGLALAAAVASPLLIRSLIETVSGSAGRRTEAAPETTETTGEVSTDEKH